MSNNTTHLSGRTRYLDPVCDCARAKEGREREIQHGLKMSRGKRIELSMVHDSVQAYNLLLACTH